MSQSGNIRGGTGGGGSGTVTDLQGDIGGPVPPTSGIIHISGANTTFNTGNPGTSTMDIEVVSSPFTFLQGAGPTTPSVALGPLNNGQLIVGSTGAQASAANLTAGTNITITNGPGSITINSTAGSTVGVDVQIFTTSGTYTPTANMTFAWVQLVGGGGGGGGCPILLINELSCGSGGGSGGYASGVFDAATIGASQSITIGSGGTAGTGTGSAGNGGNTSFGALMIGNGGIGGQTSASSTDQSFVGSGATGGIATGGDYQIKGGSGSGSFGYSYLNAASAARIYAIAGWGGSGQLGQGGGNSITVQGSQTFGENGAGYGSGGSGGASAFVGGAVTGGTGAPGIVIITEYLSNSGGGGSGFIWNRITTNTNALPNNGYIPIGGGTITINLPAIIAKGDIIEICGQTDWILVPNVGQNIIFNLLTTTAPISSTEFSDCIRLVCTLANTVYQVISSEGNITV